GVQARADDAEVLRIITWADYVPAEVVAQFRKETGIQVQVTLSNNEEMISKLHATGGAGFDLAQPSQDRILAAQQEFRIYKPLDTSKVRLDEFLPELLDGVRSGEIDAAMMWDSGGWALNRENPDIKFINPRSGAIAWMDTFALPARGRNDAAAYAWINFVMRPEIAAKVARSVGNFTA